MHPAPNPDGASLTVVPMPPRKTHKPRLTAEKGGIPSRVALGQGHPVVRLAQDGGEDAAESAGAVLWGGGVSGVGWGGPPHRCPTSTHLVLEVILAQVSGLGGPAISVGQGTLPG